MPITIILLVLVVVMIVDYSISMRRLAKRLHKGYLLRMEIENKIDRIEWTLNNLKEDCVREWSKRRELEKYLNISFKDEKVETLPAKYVKNK